MTLRLRTCLCGAGRGGARLSHNHERQYAYVLQSLLLWSEIATSMFKLWCLAEQDLLSRKNRYQLRDTGQGLNRVQVCARTPATLPPPHHSERNVVLSDRMYSSTHAGSGTQHGVCNVALA